MSKKQTQEKSDFNLKLLETTNSLLKNMKDQEGFELDKIIISVHKDNKKGKYVAHHVDMSWLW